MLKSLIPDSILSALVTYLGAATTSLRGVLTG